MKNSILVTAAAALVLVTAGCDKLKSRDQLNKGVEAYKNAKFGEAVDHFKTSIALDPTTPNARLFLATAYMNQYIPGAESEENARNLKAARDEFMKVLQENPKEKLAYQSLASLSLNEVSGLTDLDAKLKKLDEARDWNLKVIALDPANKDAYYTLGVIDWSKWKPAYDAARVKLGMKPEDPGPFKDKAVREELRDKYGPMIDDGMKNLQKALDIDPQYDEAMAYMNLFYRERADLQDTPDVYKKDIDAADSWLQKALDTRKIKAAKAAAAAPGGINQESPK